MQSYLARANTEPGRRDPQTRRPYDPLERRLHGSVAFAGLPGAPAGDAVGTTDTQVLANKTFDGPIAVDVVADGAFPAGTVLTVSTTTDNQVTLSDRNAVENNGFKYNDLHVLGIAVTASAGAGSTVSMAVGGEVPVRVDDGEGVVARGDMLWLSDDTPGAAAKTRGHGTGWYGSFCIAMAAAAGPGAQLVPVRFLRAEVKSID
jgi:hypothetical protein